MIEERSKNHRSDPKGLIHSVILGGLSLAIVLSALLVIRQLYVVDLPAGNIWKQADWLINRELVDIRRGYVGSWIIGLADVLGTDPLSVVVGVQSVLVALLYGLFLREVWSQENPVFVAILVFCPALFITAWPADLQGSVRKELLSYIAILLALWGLRRDRPVLTALGGIMMGIGVYGNEANILFVPLFAALFWVFRAQYGRAHFFGVALCALLGGHAFWYALSHLGVADARLVCAPLLDRGLAPELCDGAIAWTQENASDARQVVLERYGPVDKLAAAIAIYLAALVPVIYATWHLHQRRVVLLWIGLMALPFLPLYVVAIDWGRWLGFHMFSVVVLLLAGLAAGRFTVARTPTVSVVVLIAVTSLLWSPKNVGPGTNFLWVLRTLFGLFGGGS